ncbi:unnamed protein product, partial [marine sediment metagenome]
PKPGTEYIFEIDVVVVALGTRPNPIIPSTTKDLETTRWGTILTNEATGKTSKPGVKLTWRYRTLRPLLLPKSAG